MILSKESLQQLKTYLDADNELNPGLNKKWYSFGTLLRVAQALWNLEERSAAQMVIEEVRQLKELSSPWREGTSVLLAKLGRGDEAWPLYNKERPESGYAKFLEVSDLCRLAEGFRIGGNSEEARRLLNDAISLLNRIRKEKLKVLEGGTEKYETFEDSSLFHREGLVPIGKLQAHLGNFTDAEHTLAQTHQDLQDHILYAIFETQLEHGQTLASRKTVARMQWGSADVLRTQIQFGDITGAKLTFEKLIEIYNNLEWYNEYRKSLARPYEHPEYLQNLRMIGGARAQKEELGPLLEWARSQPNTELKIFALLGIAEGLVGIDNTICCMGEPYELSSFRI